MRVHVDDRGEKVNLKIRDAQMQKIPFMLVLCGREAEAGNVSVRHRKRGDEGVVPIAEFIARAQQLIATQSSVD